MVEKQIIFTDDPEIENIILDFPKYAEIISGIILGSKPKFTIGIFGEWGTGKTTLMQGIQKILEEDIVNCVQFNAWRYEREKSHATIPLMMSIIENLLSKQEIQNILDKEDKKGFRKHISRILKGLSFSASVGIPSIANIGINYDFSKITEELEKSSAEDIKNMIKQNRPILQEGVELIESLLEMINENTKNPDLKLVIFIDDLDRCTPNKAAEVFESIKIFFDQKGIVFVLGLSKNIIEAAIDSKYNELKGLFTGNDYLKKIIQVPFSIPAWNPNDLETYIDNLIEKEGDSKYREFFKKNSTRISRSVEPNPREIKRFLNNFIIANEIHGNNSKINKEKLLAVQALSLRWKWFYDKIFTDSKIFYELDRHWFSKIGKFTKVAASLSTTNTTTRSVTSTKGVEEVEKDPSLVRFLKDEKSGKILFDIVEKEWPLYRRVSISEPIIDKSTDNKLTNLLNEKEDLEKQIIYEEEFVQKTENEIEHLKNLKENSKLSKKEAKLNQDTQDELTDDMYATDDELRELKENYADIRIEIDKRRKSLKDSE